MEKNMVILGIIGCVIISLFIIGSVILSAYKEYNKSLDLEHKNLQASKEKEIVFKPVDYESDLKCLNDIMGKIVSTECLEKLLISTSDANNKKIKLINDQEFVDLCVEISYKISSSLSNDYIKILNLYINDIDNYIYDNVYSQCFDIAMKINKNNINKM